MRWLKRLLYIVLFLLAVAIAVPFVIPLSAYISRIEKLASEKIHEPVHIQSLHAAFLPVPRLNIGGVTIGAGQDLKIEGIHLSFEILSLLKPVKVIDSIELEGVSSNQEMLAKLPSWLKSEEPAAPQRVLVKKIVFNRLSVGLRRLTLGPLEGEIRLQGTGNFEQARIATEDTKLRFLIKPENGNFLIDASAKNWQPPVGPALLFDELNIQAVANQSELDMRDIAGTLYGGSIKGNARLNWLDGWRLSGILHSNKVELKDLVQLFSKETTVSGKLNADATYLLQGKTADKMTPEPINAKFRISDGVLFNMDLVGAVKSLASKGVHGGQTRFDTLSGEVRVVGKTYRFRELKVASGLLSASGDVNISSAKQLTGDVDVQLKGTANLVNVPLNVSGSVNDPVLRPTNAALAGAVAGTAMLGPGVGTSLGIKAGQFTENLFK